MRVFACNVVSKLQQNRCITFGDWRSRRSWESRVLIYFRYSSTHASIRLQRCVKIATKSVHYFRRLEVPKTWPLHFIYIGIYRYIYIYKSYIYPWAYSPATLCQNCNEICALLSEIGGPERTGRYIFIYIDLKDLGRNLFNLFYM
jgi:hypothetical protein